MLSVVKGIARAAAALVLSFACGCGAKTSPSLPGASLDAGMDAASRDAGMDAPALDAPTDAGRADAPLADAECDSGPVVLDAGGPELVVDLLFVVDNSLSMQEEQRALALQFPEMVRILATGDLDGDRTPDFHPVRDMQVGVVTTELWVPEEDMGCEIAPGSGSDGVLRTDGIPFEPSCARSYPRFLRFRPGEGDPDAFAHDFGCVAVVGTRGCGIEQPLEAALKALAPADGPWEFLYGTGHGDGANEGFAREGSVLAVVVVTDENDCSFRDPELFDPESARYRDPTTGFNARALRCFAYPEALHPPSRYADALRALRPEPDTLLFAAVTGVPADLVTDPHAIDYDALLADPRMDEHIDPGRDRLAPACDVVGVGFALPSRRIVEVARELSYISVVQSICQDDFSGALAGITERLARIIRRRSCR
jgi:hypothetical protein